MPQYQYRITDPTTGRTLTVSGGPEPPTDAEAEALFEEARSSAPRSPVAGRGTGYDPRNVAPNLESLKRGSIENMPQIAAALAAIGTSGASLPAQAAWVGGSALAGQGAKDLIQKGVVDPASALWEGGTQAAMQYGGGKLAQGLVAAGPRLQEAGVNVLNRIAKPTKALLEKVGNEWGAFHPERAKNLAQAFLDRGLRITKPAVIQDQVDAAENLLEQQIAGSTARGSTAPSVQNLEEAAQQARYQSLPESDQAAFASTLEEYRRNPLLSKVTRSKQSVPMGGLVDASGNPIMTEAIEVTGRDLIPTATVQKLQRIKRGTYRSLGDKAYGEIGSASREGQKQLARGQASAIEAVEPKVKPINEEIGKLIDMRDYAEEAGKRTGNVNPISLTAQVALAAKSPSLAFALFERPLLGEPLARGLYGAGGMFPKVMLNPADLYRLAVIAQMQSDEQNLPPTSQ